MMGSFFGALIPLQGNEIFCQKQGLIKTFALIVQKHGAIFQQKTCERFLKRNL